MGNRRGIIYEAIARLDSLMAPGESRFTAKVDARRNGVKFWSFSTGSIHSFRTRQAYQQHVLHFINWCRQEHQVKRLDKLDANAESFSAQYLAERVQLGKSAYTVQAERAALRVFFGQRTLAEKVQLPKRMREHIQRSRVVTGQDRHFQPDNWPDLIHFLRSCGLRREEVKALFVREIYVNAAGHLVVYVRNGKGGLAREVWVLPGREQFVWSVVKGRDPGEHVFIHIPKNMDVHSYRREYAQALYLYLAPGYVLPPSSGRLKPADYDRDAAMIVSKQLGHHRIDVVLRHYLR